MAYKITDIEGIGPAMQEKFNTVGIKTVEKLLDNTKTRKQREQLAAELNIDKARLLKFANLADLFRIKGVSSQYSELLEAAGVDTIKELRNRNAANLHAKMKSCNDERKLVRQIPSLSQVESMINHAKELEPSITY